MFELRVIKGPGVSSKGGPLHIVDEGQAALVGRSEDCQIQLPSAGVSKKHCLLTPLSPTRLEVEDLGSSNGTYVNGLLVKKHILKPGDTLGIHSFVLQVVKKAPEVPAAAPSEEFSTDFESNSIDVESSRKKDTIADKFTQWLEDAVYPGADKLSAKTDVRLLVVAAVGIWTLLVTTLSLNPFKESANARSREESVEVAKLYSRQLVRLNQRAVIEQRYKDLISDLDSYVGQTPGVLTALIIDTQNGQILAPPERLGQTLPETERYRFARVAIGRQAEHVSINEDEKIAWVSAPIKIGTNEGNKTVASVLVEYSYVDGQFTINNLIDQITNSMVYALILSLLFIVYIYRWIDGSLRRTAKETEKALREERNAVDLQIVWPSLQLLHQEIGFSLAKAMQAGGDAGDGMMGSAADWAIASVDNTQGAAASFDPALTVTAWNQSMERLTGIQSTLAVGSDISEASRDVAFESAVRELADQAVMMPWTPQSRAIDFSGRDYTISVVSGNSSILVNIDEEEAA